MDNELYLDKNVNIQSVNSELRIIKINFLTNNTKNG